MGEFKIDGHTITEDDGDVLVVMTSYELLLNELLEMGDREEVLQIDINTYTLSLKSGQKLYFQLMRNLDHLNRLGGLIWGKVIALDQVDDDLLMRLNCRCRTVESAAHKRFAEVLNNITPLYPEELELPEWSERKSKEPSLEWYSPKNLKLDGVWNLCNDVPFIVDSFGVKRDPVTLLEIGSEGLVDFNKIKIL